jgi:hypothetical protein
MTLKAVELYQQLGKFPRIVDLARCRGLNVFRILKEVLAFRLATPIQT